jgi:Secretion system C-terminal sorting domain
MNKHFAAAVILALVTFTASAQFSIGWESVTNNGQSGYEYTEGVALADGGVIAVGNGGNGECQLARFDSNGAIVWMTSYQHNGDDTRLYDVCAHPGVEDEFIAVGRVTFNSFRGFVLVFDDAGSVVSGTMSATPSTFYSVAPTLNGGIVAVGVYNNDGVMHKFDSNLNTQWVQEYQVSNRTTVPYDIIQASDGNYVIGGFVGGISQNNPYIEKRNQNGGAMWSNVSNQRDGRGYSVVESPDQGFILTGNVEVDGYQFFVLKVTSNGGFDWVRDYGAVDALERAEWIGVAPGGGYYLYGEGLSGASWGGWLVKINESGGMEWNQIFDRPNGYNFINCCFSLDGNNIFAFGQEDGIPSALYLAENPSLTAEITAISPPVVIPAGGGSFGYSVTAVNNSAFDELTDAWIQVQHNPTGMSVEPHVFYNVNVPANTSASANLSQMIPGGAPAGEYQISLYLGEYPWVLQANASHIFTKEGAAADDWNLSIFNNPEQWISHGSFGDSDAEITTISNPGEYELSAAYPNPFNPSTMLSVSLPEASTVNVAVFDVLGRRVAELANGQHPAGIMQLPFDGSQLSGGIYFVHASANGWSSAQKVVLIK